VLCLQQYHQQSRGARGLIRLYLAKMTGLSRAQVTRLVARYRRHGTVQPGVYRRHRFPQRYTRADLELQVSNGYVGKFLKAGLNFDWSALEDDFRTLLHLRLPENSFSAT
jgi:hypothetical protein